MDALRGCLRQRQHLIDIEARELVPNATTLLHCLLQSGVQSPAIREADAAALSNAKRLETDAVALVRSGRMLKAATCN
eukprot:2646051-Rhodomonas_salina.1